MRRVGSDENVLKLLGVSTRGGMDVVPVSVILQLEIFVCRSSLFDHGICFLWKFKTLPSFQTS